MVAGVRCEICKSDITMEPCGCTEQDHINMLRQELADLKIEHGDAIRVLGGFMKSNNNQLKWIKADIYGNGERWLLGFERDGNLVFPLEEFEDDCENYTKNVSCPVYNPEQLMEIKEKQVEQYKKLAELATAVCRTACGTYNDNRSSVDRKKLQALTKFLFEHDKGGDVV